MSPCVSSYWRTAHDLWRRYVPPSRVVVVSHRVLLVFTPDPPGCAAAACLCVVPLACRLKCLRVGACCVCLLLYLRQDLIGFTPLHYAVYAGRCEVVEMLCRRLSLRGLSVEAVLEAEVNGSVTISVDGVVSPRVADARRGLRVMRSATDPVHVFRQTVFAAVAAAKYRGDPSEQAGADFSHNSSQRQLQPEPQPMQPSVSVAGGDDFKWHSTGVLNVARKISARIRGRASSAATATSSEVAFVSGGHRLSGVREDAEAVEVSDGGGPGEAHGDGGEPPARGAGVLRATRRLGARLLARTASVPDRTPTGTKFVSGVQRLFGVREEGKSADALLSFAHGVGGHRTGGGEGSQQSPGAEGGVGVGVGVAPSRPPSSSLPVPGVPSVAAAAAAGPTVNRSMRHIYGRAATTALGDSVFLISRDISRQSNRHLPVAVVGAVSSSKLLNGSPVRGVNASRVLRGDDAVSPLLDGRPLSSGKGSVGEARGGRAPPGLLPHSGSTALPDGLSPTQSTPKAGGGGGGKRSSSPLNMLRRWQQKPPISAALVSDSESPTKSPPVHRGKALVPPSDVLAARASGDAERIARLHVNANANPGIGTAPPLSIAIAVGDGNGGGSPGDHTAVSVGSTSPEAATPKSAGPGRGAEARTSPPNLRGARPPPLDMGDMSAGVGGSAAARARDGVRSLDLELDGGRTPGVTPRVQTVGKSFAVHGLGDTPSRDRVHSLDLRKAMHEKRLFQGSAGEVGDATPLKCIVHHVSHVSRTTKGSLGFGRGVAEREGV